MHLHVLYGLLMGCAAVLAPLRAGDLPPPGPQEPGAPGSAEPAGSPKPGLLGRVDTSRSELRGLIGLHETDRATLRRSYRIPMSPRARERMRRFYEDYLRALASIDFAELSQDGRVDYLLLQNHLRHQLRGLQIRSKRDAEIAPLLPFREPIIELEESRRRMETLDPVRAAQQLADLVRKVQEAREAVEAGLRSDEENSGALRASRTAARRAAGRVSELRGALERWYGFYNGYDPLFTWWAKVPYRQADKELLEYADLLRERLAGLKKGDEDTILGDPIGREALLSELASELIPYTPEELIEIARRELAWCEAEMARASRELGYGDEWRKALERVKTQHVEPGKQPELIRRLAQEAVEFLEERDLLTIPQLCREVWRMEMMTPEQQKVNPYFAGGEIISVSFPTDEMTHEAKMMSLRSNNIHFARATVHHELIPGHHLQGFMIARHRTYRRPFRTAFWIEGWALYWEMLLWDLDFPQSPENRIGMLFWRMHRCARIIFSLNFHLEKMTAQEAIDFLVAKVGHERSAATAEVRRSVSGAYGPLYQCAYMLGGLQLRALHKELVQSGRMSNREFHDAVLRQNAIPIELIRASLTGQPLSREFSSSWRFYHQGPRTS